MSRFPPTRSAVLRSMVEDPHWIDSNSAEMLRSLVDALPERRVQLLCTCRSGAPADMVVVDESITVNLELFGTFAFAGPADYFSGGIG